MQRSDPKKLLTFPSSVPARRPARLRPWLSARLLAASCWLLAALSLKMPTCFFSARPNQVPSVLDPTRTTVRVALARSDNDVSLLMSVVSHVHAEKYYYICIDIHLLVPLVCVASSADYDSSVDAKVGLATTPATLPVPRRELHTRYRKQNAVLFVFKAPSVFCASGPCRARRYSMRADVQPPRTHTRRSDALQGLAATIIRLINPGGQRANVSGTCGAASANRTQRPPPPRPAITRLPMLRRPGVDGLRPGLGVWGRGLACPVWARLHAWSLLLPLSSRAAVWHTPQ